MRESPSRYIKSLAEKRRAREANEAAERAAAAAAGVRGKSAGGPRGGRTKPLKAFSEVQPKVRIVMIFRGQIWAQSCYGSLVLHEECIVNLSQ